MQIIVYREIVRHLLNKGLCYLQINWHTVFWGMSLQFIMAVLILKTSWGADIIRWIADRFMEYADIGSAGSTFLFGPNYRDHNFVFGVIVNFLFCSLQSLNDRGTNRQTNALTPAAGYICRMLYADSVSPDNALQQRSLMRSDR